jgi:hypothetical protein
MKGAEAVSVQGQVGGVVNTVESLVDSYQFSSIVGPGGPNATWVNGEAHTFLRDIYSRSNLIRLGWFAFDKATICVGLEP